MFLPFQLNRLRFPVAIAGNAKAAGSAKNAAAVKTCAFGRFTVVTAFVEVSPPYMDDENIISYQ